MQTNAEQSDDRRRILCFGDSNTWGFDPRDMLEARYPREQRWTTQLEAALPEYRIRADGLNGRCIPRLNFELQILEDEIRKSRPLALLILMLGTNDWLRMAEPDPEVIRSRAEAMLRFLLEPGTFPGGSDRILLLSPPQMDHHADPEMARYDTRDGRLSQALQEAAKKAGVRFADTGPWELPMAYDHIHLSEEGHRLFASRLTSLLREILP